MPKRLKLSKQLEYRIAQLARERFTVAQIASQVGVSRSTVDRRVREALGRRRVERLPSQTEPSRPTPAQRLCLALTVTADALTEALVLVRETIDLLENEDAS